MLIKRIKYKGRILFINFTRQRCSGCLVAGLLFTAFFFFHLSVTAQNIQVVPNPDASSGGYVGSPVVYNGNLYIKYQNISGNVQLAEYNGSTLTLIPNPNAGSINIFDNSSKTPFVVYNGNLYFQYQNTTGHFQLAKYDGVSVTLIPNPFPGVGDVGEPDPNFVVYNGNLYFQYYSTVAGKKRYQLAEYNGTSITVIPNPDLALDPNGYMADPIVYNNMLYIDYVNASGVGQLAQYNGVSLTLIPNPDAGAGYEGIDGSGTNSPIIYNNKLYFNYMNAAGVSQMAQYDGTTLSLVSNPDATVYGTYFDQPPIIYNSMLYMQYINASGDLQLAQYDGTSITLIPHPAGGAFFPFTVDYPWTVNTSDLYLQYYNPSGYLQLAQYNGTSISLINPPPGATAYNGSPVVYNNQLYTSFSTSTGTQLTLYDGTQLGLVPNANPADIGYSGSPLVFNNKLYFMYQNSSYVYHLAYIADCPTVSVTATDTTICAGTNVVFNVTSVDGGNNPTYQWTLDGAAVQTGTTYSSNLLQNNDMVIATLTNKSSACTGVHPADTLIMTVNPIPVATITGNTCQNSVLTATSNPTDTIAWQRNDTTLLKQVASLGNTYTASIPGAYTDMIISAAGCTSPLSDTIVVATPVIASVSIASDTNNVCNGVNITLTATPTNGGPTPFYQWKVNSVNAGTNNNTLSNTAFNNNDTVTCWMTSSAGCFTPSPAISNKVILSVIDSPAVSVTISSDTNNICFGTPVTFSAAAVNAGATPSYQWSIDGSTIGSNTSAFISSGFSNGSTISCVLTSSEACTIPVVSSNMITMVVYPLPIVTDSADTTIPFNTSVALNLPDSGNIVQYLWTPAATLSDPAIKNPVASPTVNTTYHLLVTNAHGCTASGEMTVNLFSGLQMPNAFSPNGDNLNDVFRIPPYIKFNLSFFSVFDRWGGLVFTTTDPSVGWDGTYNGIPAAVATYVWVIEYTDPLTNMPAQAKGTVELIR